MAALHQLRSPTGLWCPQRATIANGRIVYSKELDQNYLYPKATTAWVECDPGFFRASLGGSITTEIVCVTDAYGGQLWSSRGWAGIDILGGCKKETPDKYLADFVARRIERFYETASEQVRYLMLLVSEERMLQLINFLFFRLSVISACI